ncbi:MAG: carbohydrate porin [Deltaproteobacteria bacterium]|nr:carbohydrate porin [Deltaproteobacteria bacterium]
MATAVILAIGVAWADREPTQLWADTSNPHQLSSGALANSGEQQPQTWNWYIQNTDIMQGYPPFHAKYSGANSLPTGGQIRQNVSADLYAGVRLWLGAEAHFDGVMWQGFGLHNTFGIDDFPNGEADKAGTVYPRLDIARLFIRQIIGLGGEQEYVPADELTLAGKHDISRLAITVGRIRAIDIFDDNSYAGDPSTQFMNWAFVTDTAWDYPADSLGFTTGLTLEVNQRKWALRYGFFQIPAVANSWTAEDALFVKPGYQSIKAGDGKFWHDWGMAAEFERRYNLRRHPAKLRFLAFLNQGHMGSYTAALSVPGIDITKTSACRRNYGFGLNWEQTITHAVGLFSRVGWNLGRNQAWMFTDVNYTASLGISIKGQAWHRSDDTFGVAGAISGISRANERYLEAGGRGILDGDGALSYGWEKILETYYDFPLWKSIHLAADYQFVADPAFNKDRGPVNVLGTRLHLEF